MATVGSIACFILLHRNAWMFDHLYDYNDYIPRSGGHHALAAQLVQANCGRLLRRGNGSVPADRVGMRGVVNILYLVV